MIPFDQEDYSVLTSKYLDDETVSARLEKKIRGDLTIESEPLDLKGQLMNVDTTLTARISNTLDLVEIPRNTAVYGGSADIAIPLGTTDIDEAQIKCYRLANKSIYEEKAANDPEYRAKMDMAALNGITERRNEARVEAIIANVGALVTPPTSPGTFLVEDLNNMEATIQVSDSETRGRKGEGGRMTNLMFHPYDWARLKNDPRTGDLQRTELIMYTPGGGMLHQFRDRPFKALVTNFATEYTVVAWDFDRYMLEAVSMEVTEKPYDQSLTGEGDAQGTRFKGLVGFGRKVHGEHYVTSMDIRP